MVAGEQTVVRPSGFDADVKETVPENPPVAATEIVDHPESPEANEMAAGLTVSDKSGCGTGVTDTPIDALWVRFPLVPLILTVYDPIVVAFIVQVDDWLLTRVDGEQDVVTPDGEELAFRLTEPEKPPVDWSVIVDAAELFTTNVTLFGFAVKEKSGGETVASIVAVWTRVPFVPVIVTT